MRRKTKFEARSEATRASLVEVARRLFTDKGYAATGTQEIVEAAGVTRGALYHHYEGKRELFEAVFEALEQEITDRVLESVAGIDDPLEAVRIGSETYFEACLEPDVQRIALVEAPAVLGWDRWRAAEHRYALGLVREGLEQAAAKQLIAALPLDMLAPALLAAINELALLVARSQDGARAREAATTVLDGIIAGMRAR